MADFPQNAVIFDTDPTWTADMARVEFEKWLNATLQLMGAREPEALSIATGQIAPTRAMVIVDTESQAEADDLETIAAGGLHAGAVITLHAADPGRVVTVKHGTGADAIELMDGADVALSSRSWLWLRRTGGRWVEFGARGEGGGGWELSPGATVYMRRDDEVTYTAGLLDISYGDVDYLGYGYDDLSGDWANADAKFVAAFRMEAYGEVAVSQDVWINNGGGTGYVMACVFLNGEVARDFMLIVSPSDVYRTYTCNVTVKPGDVIAVKIANGAANQVTKAKNVRILVADLGA